MRAAIRHRLQAHGETPIFKTGDLMVDLVRRIVTVRGEEVKLTPREYDLLRLFVMLLSAPLLARFLRRRAESGMRGRPAR